jgi:hypothetical protein
MPHDYNTEHFLPLQLMRTIRIEKNSAPNLHKEFQITR